MKNLFLKALLVVGVFVGTFSSCTTVNRSMREPNARVEFEKSDFTLSDQVTATATSTKILGIDFQRLFTKESGNVEGGALNISLASLPVVGNIVTDKTASYALHQLMSQNPGYDVIFYPQYETRVVKPIGLGFIYKKTTEKTTARLGKLKQ
jgi:hypothetical protein